MALIQYTRTVCDRCSKDAPDRAEHDPPALDIDELNEVIHYDDLCDDCAGVCRDYLRRLARLEPLRRRAPKVLAPLTEDDDCAPGMEDDEPIERPKRASKVAP